MSETSADPHRFSPADLKQRLAAERTGSAFLVYRDEDGQQHIFNLDQAPESVTVGRSPGNGISLEWDEEVSRLHAEISKLGDNWTLADDGLSSNGSFVNDKRVSARCRLQDGDEIRVGATVLVFRLPAGSATAATALSARSAEAASVSPAQRKVLVSLCRPYRDAGDFPSPATNKQIAEELVLSVPAVKAHLRALATKFEVNDLPQNRKRLRLVELAFQSGLVTEQDL